MACNFDPNGHLSWDVLSPYILPFVLGVPDELMAHHARLSCIEFCIFSGVLRDENFIDLQKGVQDYYLTTVCDYQIIRVYSVTMLNRWVLRPTINRPVVPIGAPFNTAGYYGTSWWCGPYGFWMYDNTTCHITPATQQDFPAGLRVEFVVAPKQDGCTYNNFLYQNYSEGIAAGAIYRLKLIKGQPWYDPEGAKEWQKVFHKAKCQARAAIDRNFTSGPLMMTTQRWV